MEWQPIETAPKDGTPVILYRPPTFIPGAMMDTVVVGVWVETFDGEDIKKWCWPTEPCNIFDESDLSIRFEEGENYESNGFTLWMPLPEPPEEG